MALEFGRVYDGQPPESWQSMGEHLGFLRDGSHGPIVGFAVEEFSRFEVDDPEVGEIWTACEFEVPLLGLPKASAGEIILAARPLVGDHSTVNRQLFCAAIDRQHDDPQEALSYWLSCLEAGDCMAHFALGYTLHELGRHHEAYRHLRYYTQIAPAAPWNWCWLGRAAHAIGEVDEARSAYEHAIELSDSEQETDAADLLRQLDDRETNPSCGSPSEYLDLMAAQPGESESCYQILGERFEDALQFAAGAHRTQVRKGSGIPYVGHLLGVCSLVIEDCGSEDEVIAALLHDAVEDQGGHNMLEHIRARFGDQVAQIVEACSDTMENPKPPWRTRKETYLEHLAHQSQSALRVSLADKLFNARAILRDYRVVGDEIWARFRTGQDDQLWYYRQLADRFTTLLPSPMATELSEVVDELEKAVIARSTSHERR